MTEAPTPPHNFTTPNQVSYPGTPPTDPSATQAGCIASLKMPTVTSLTPNTIAKASADALVTVAGTNFEPGCTIFFGATPLKTTYVSATSCTAIFPHSGQANAGTVAIKVQNVNPSAVSGTSNFTYT